MPFVAWYLSLFYFFLITNYVTLVHTFCGFTSPPHHFLRLYSRNSCFWNKVYKYFKVSVIYWQINLLKDCTNLHFSLQYWECLFPHILTCWDNSSIFGCFAWHFLDYKGDRYFSKCLFPNVHKLLLPTLYLFLYLSFKVTVKASLVSKTQLSAFNKDEDDEDICSGLISYTTEVAAP